MPARPTRRARLGLGAGAVAGAALLLALALPLAVGEMLRLPGAATSPDSPRFMDAEGRAFAAVPGSAGALALGLGHLAVADRRSGARARLHLETAERLLTRGLAGGPAHPDAWTRLAVARWRLGRPEAAVGQALRLALLSGPTTRHLAPVRAELALRLGWQPRRPTESYALAAQFRLAWRRAPALLAHVAAAQGARDLLHRSLAR